MYPRRQKVIVSYPNLILLNVLINFKMENIETSQGSCCRLSRWRTMLQRTEYYQWKRKVLS